MSEREKEGAIRIRDAIEKKSKPKVSGKKDPVLSEDADDEQDSLDDLAG